MDRLGSMSVLVAAVEAGSLSAAARRLGMPLTSVSRKILDLEAHLRIRLLNRSSRRVTLTEAGRTYLEACRRILDDVNEAERAATGEYSAPKGELVVTAPIVFGRLHVIPIAVEFLKLYPEVDIRFILADRLVNLLEDRVDLAVRIGELPDSSLVATRIGAIRRVVCGSPSYFAKRGIPQNPTDLAGHDCITFQGLSAPDAWNFRTARGQASIPVHSRLVVNTASAAIDAAIAGAGITRVLSYQIADAIRAGTLAIVLDKFEWAPWPISFIHSGQGFLPLKLRSFLDLATPRLRARLSSGIATPSS